MLRATLGTALADCLYWKTRYEVLREAYREQHPRITHDAIDAWIDGRMDGTPNGFEPFDYAERS